MYRITYYIGCNDKDTLKQELLDAKIIRVIDNLFEDYTISKAYGRFTNKDGVKTFEKSFVVTIITDCNCDIDDVCIYNNCFVLKSELNQESILVTKELIQASFM
jgi:hypothetical protein